MTAKDFEDEPRDESSGTDDAGTDEPGTDSDGPEAQASGPAGAETAPDGAETAPDGAEAETGDEWTVDDILNAAQSGEAAETDPIAAVEAALLHDLKRLQAEYANYRKRTEEQREVEIARAKGEAAKGLLPVLDDLDRAEQHGDLIEGTAFTAIAEKVRAVVERLGVVAYGEAGEVFDPQQHEAIFQQPTPGATEATLLEVVEVGYRLGEVELRPAKVVVAVPAE